MENAVLLGECFEAKVTSSGVAKSGLKPFYAKILLPRTNVDC